MSSNEFTERRMQELAGLLESRDVFAKARACLQCIEQLSAVAGQGKGPLSHTYKTLHTLLRRLLVIHPDLVRSKSLVPFPASFEQILTLQDEDDQQLSIGQILHKKRRKEVAAENATENEDHHKKHLQGATRKEHEEQEKKKKELDDRQLFLFPSAELVNDLPARLNPNRLLQHMLRNIREHMRLSDEALLPTARPNSVTASPASSAAVVVPTSSSSSSNATTSSNSAFRAVKRSAISSAAFDRLTGALMAAQEKPSSGPTESTTAVHGSFVLYKSLANQLVADNDELNAVLADLRAATAAANARIKDTRERIETLEESNCAKHMQTVVFSNKEELYESNYEQTKRRVDKLYEEMNAAKQEGEFLDLERDRLRKKFEERLEAVHDKHLKAHEEHKNIRALEELEELSDAELQSKLVDMKFRLKEAKKLESILTEEWTALEKDRENLVTQVEILEQATETMHLMTDEFVEMDEEGHDAMGKTINTNVPDNIAALLPALRNKRLLNDGADLPVKDGKKKDDIDTSDSDEEDMAGGVRMLRAGSAMDELLLEKHRRSNSGGRNLIQCYGRGNNIPPFLRYDGHVTDLEMNKGHVELIVKEIWALKTMKDHDRGHHGLPALTLAEFFHSYLAQRFPKEEKFMEFSYSFIAAARKNTYDEDIDLFLKVLFNELSEEHYYDQMTMMAHLKKLFLQLDRVDRVKDGLIHRNVFFAGLMKFFPQKTQKNLRELQDIANRDMQSLGPDGSTYQIDIRKLLHENDIGDQSAFIECVRKQYQTEMLEFPRTIYESLMQAARQYAQPYRFNIMKEPYKSNIYETLLEQKNQAERDEQLRKAREEHRRQLMRRAQQPRKLPSGASSSSIMLSAVPEAASLTTTSASSTALTLEQKKEENKIEQALLALHAQQREEEEKRKELFLPAGQIACILQGLDPYKPPEKIDLFMKVGMGLPYDDHFAHHGYSQEAGGRKEAAAAAPSVNGVADAIHMTTRQGNYVELQDPHQLINVKDFYKRLSFLFLHRTGHYAPLSETDLMELDEMVDINNRTKNLLIMRMEEENRRYVAEMKALAKQRKREANMPQQPKLEDNLNRKHAA